MDIIAALTQSAEPFGDGVVPGTAKSAEIPADMALLLAEFHDLTDAAGQIDELPEATEQPSADVSPDPILEILDKMTGVTGAVSPRLPAVPHQEETGDVVEFPVGDFSPTGMQPSQDFGHPQSKEAGGNPDDELANDISQSDQTDDPEATGNAKLTNDVDVARPAGSLPQHVPQDRNPTDSTSPKPFRNDAPKTSLKRAGGLDKVPLESNSPAPVLPNDDKSRSFPKGSGEHGGVEIARHGVPAEPVQKPAAPVMTELKAIVPPSVPDLASPDAQQIRMQPEMRPSQMTPPVVLRQITDTVVTMRDEMVEIRLSPEELGRVRMVLTGQDRTPHLTIWVDRPEVLEQMRRQGDSLLQQLRDQGMSGASLDFRDGRQAPENEQQEQNFDRRHEHSSDEATLAMAASAKPSRVPTYISGSYGIDIRV